MVHPGIPPSLSIEHALDRKEREASGRKVTSAKSVRSYPSSPSTRRTGSGGCHRLCFKPHHKSLICWGRSSSGLSSREQGWSLLGGGLRKGSSLNGPVFTELAGGRVQGFLQIRCGHVMKGHVWVSEMLSGAEACSTRPGAEGGILGTSRSGSLCPVSTCRPGVGGGLQLQ